MSKKDKKINLPEETIEKLLNNEYQINDIGIDDVVVPAVVVKDDEYNEADGSAIENDIENDDNGTDIETDNTVEIEYNENIDYKGRGFKTLDDAIDFLNSPVFARLGEADKEEYKKWLLK